MKSAVIGYVILEIKTNQKLLNCFFLN